MSSMAARNISGFSRVMMVTQDNMLDSWCDKFIFKRVV